MTAKDGSRGEVQKKEARAVDKGARMARIIDDPLSVMPLRILNQLQLVWCCQPVCVCMYVFVCFWKKVRHTHNVLAI